MCECRTDYILKKMLVLSIIQELFDVHGSSVYSFEKFYGDLFNFLFFDLYNRFILKDI